MVSIQPTIGSLCTGYGGLDMAVEAYFQAETLWTAEFDKYASLIVNERIKKPNLGDLTKIDWQEIQPIDILTAGYPCQPFSHAGNRKGINDQRHIFPYIAKAIEVLRPSIIVLENVRGHLTLGFEEVLATLTQLGYDAKWQIVRASEVGAPHQRARLFIVAYPSEFGCESQLCDSKSEKPFNSITSNADGCPCEKSRRTDRGLLEKSKEIINRANRSVNGCCSENAQHSSSEFKSHDGQMQKLGFGSIARCKMHLQDIPTSLDSKGRLNPQFVEYMMGLPKGWVTDLELSRTQQLKILGNGVVPQQAYYALEQLLG